MKNSKLIVNLQALSSSELRRFGEFVHSPFFNKHRDTQLLFDVLHVNNSRWHKLTKEEIHAKIYTGKFKEEKINNLMFYLMELLRKFLIQLEFEQSEDQAEYILNSTLKRGMSKLFRSECTKERLALKKVKIKDRQYFNRVFKLEKSFDESNVLKGKHLPAFFEKEDHALEAGFILDKLKNTCDMMNRMMVFNAQYNFGILDNLLPYIRNRWDVFGEIKIINIYYKVLLTFLEPDKDKHFFELADSLEKNSAAFNLEDTKLLYRYAINKGISLINIDEISYIDATYKLHKSALYAGALLDDKEIRHLDFKNITVLACKLKEFDWAISFMETYRNNINKVFRKNTYNFSLAFLHYHQKNYDEALVILSKMKFTNTIFYLINSKSLQIKIFYELKEYNLLLSFLESYRLVLMRNKKIGTKRIKITQNFVLHTRRFIQLLNTKEVIKKSTFTSKLSQQLEAVKTTDKPMLNKKWLIENMSKELELVQ